MNSDKKENKGDNSVNQQPPAPLNNEANQHAGKEHASGSKEKIEEIKHAVKRWNWEAIGVIGNFILIALTAWAVFFARDSVKLAEETIRKADTTFQIQNAPYLQIGDIKYYPNQAHKIYYSILNLGQYPAKVLEGRFALMGGEQAKTPFQIISPNSFSTPYFPWRTLNSYVIKESPLHYIYNKQDAFQPTEEQVRIGDVYFSGELKYTNQVNNESRQYNFQVQIFFNGDSTAFNVLLNDNFTIRR